MKNLYLLKFILLIAFSAPGVAFTSAQVTSQRGDTAYIYPESPSVKDSIHMTYVYLSSDGCPDYFLVKDSVTAGKIYVSLRKYPDSDRACITVMTWFKTHINLGTITRDTEIYFNGKLYKIIHTPCRMDMKGVVVTCRNSLYIQDVYSKSAFPQLYTFNYTTYTNTYGTKLTKPLPGDSVEFHGVFFDQYSSSDTLCKPVGKVICYQVITKPPADTIPPCVIDKAGVVVKCGDKLYFEDTSTPYASPVAQLYIIKGITDNEAVAFSKFKVGDKVKFGGFPIRSDSLSSQCHVVGVAACFRLIDSTATCTMDKKGIVEAGIDGCTGQLLIREMLTGNFYSIRKPDPATGTAGDISLKPGDKVIFGGYLTPNDSSKVVLCPIAGVAVCYRLIDTVPPCVMDKEGTVERGKDACAASWFVRESATSKLYYIKNGRVTNVDGAVRYLNEGDKMKFGAVQISTLPYEINLCGAAGIVNCYQITQTADKLTLSGYALAGNDTVKSGMAILFEKGYRKSTALAKITDGTFTFGSLHPAPYTVYVIPDREIYKNYLPTFYVDKIYYKTADFVTLKENTDDITVKMVYYERKTGTGKIYGNIYYESYKLNDSLMVKNALTNTEGTANYNLAVNATVLLINRSGMPAAWTLTDVNGNYVFTEIPYDTYKVVSETASAYASSEVVISTAQSTANRDLMLKSTDEITGITLPENTAVSLFPNPVKDKLTVSVVQEDVISIYNLNGQLNFHDKLNRGINTLDLSDIASGIYIARIGGKSFKLIKL